MNALRRSHETFVIGTFTQQQRMGTLARVAVIRRGSDFAGAANVSFEGPHRGIVGR